MRGGGPEGTEFLVEAVAGVVPEKGAVGGREGGREAGKQVVMGRKYKVAGRLVDGRGSMAKSEYNALRGKEDI